MKRLFIIIASVTVVIGVLTGVYFLFFANDEATLDVGNPFSGAGAGDVQPSGDLPTDGTLRNAGTTLAPQFVKITDGPVARGSVAFPILVAYEGGTNTTTTLGSTTASTTITATSTVPDVEVRFIDRASGNVYAYVAHTRTLTRISNKTLPGIQIAKWTPGGSRAYAQFIANSGGEEQVQTYSMEAEGGAGYLLENNLSSVGVAGSSTVFTLFSGSTGSVGTLSGTDGSNARTLFTSLLSAITVHTTSGNLYATNKPSVNLDGYAFQINRSTGAFTRILGPFRGLAVLPNNAGTSLIYSYNESGTYRLRTLDVTNRTSTALPVATLAEKCVWSANGQSMYCAVPTNMQGNLPDSWYQGSTIFSDRIWKIDMTERLATLVIDPNAVAGVSIDAVALTVDPSEDVLVFMDKHSGALYAYDL